MQYVTDLRSIPQLFENLCGKNRRRKTRDRFVNGCHNNEQIDTSEIEHAIKQKRIPRQKHFADPIICGHKTVKYVPCREK